jgi:ATP phosphoribosyltransferase
VKTILELVEARRRGRNYVQVTANIAGASAEDVGRRVASRPELAGMQGPTVAPVYAGAPTGWYTITLFVPQDRVMAVVTHLRELGGGAMAVVPAQYVFDGRCEAYERLVRELE